MPGNANSGRRPAQIDARKRLGPMDRPERPSDLAGHGAAYWASAVVPCDHLTQADTALCVECCRLYDLYRRAVVACESIPLDDEAANTAAKYFAQWQSLVKKLGLDPAGRARFAKLVTRDDDDAQVEESPEHRFFGTVG